MSVCKISNNLISYVWIKAMVGWLGVQGQMCTEFNLQ